MRRREAALASRKHLASWRTDTEQVLPHSGQGCWGESRRWGKTPRRSPRCCQPGTSLMEELVVRKQSALRLTPRRRARHSLKVLMSRLSMKSHSLSITSCTCFMHFPCSNGGASGEDVRRGPGKQTAKIRRRSGGTWTYALVAEAHGARFPFAQGEEAAVGLDEWRAGAVFPFAAHFAGVLRLCKWSQITLTLVLRSCTNATTTYFLRNHGF